MLNRIDTREALELFVEKFQKYFREKDAAGITSLYTEDVIYLLPGGRIEGREQLLTLMENVVAHGAAEIKFRLDISEICGDTCLAIGRYTFVMPDGEEGNEAQFMCYGVLTGSQWKIRAISNTW